MLKKRTKRNTNVYFSRNLSYKHFYETFTSKYKNFMEDLLSNSCECTFFDVWEFILVQSEYFQRTHAIECFCVYCAYFIVVQV